MRKQKDYLDMLLCFLFGVLLMAIIYTLMWFYVAKYEMCKEYFKEDYGRCMVVL